MRRTVFVLAGLMLLPLSGCRRMEAPTGGLLEPVEGGLLVQATFEDSPIQVSAERLEELQRRSAAPAPAPEASPSTSDESAAASAAEPEDGDAAPEPAPEAEGSASAEAPVTDELAAEPPTAEAGAPSAAVDGVGLEGESESLQADEATPEEDASSQETAPTTDEAPASGDAPADLASSTQAVDEASAPAADESVAPAESAATALLPPPAPEAPPVPAPAPEPVPPPAPEPPPAPAAPPAAAAPAATVELPPAPRSDADAIAAIDSLDRATAPRAAAETAAPPAASAILAPPKICETDDPLLAAAISQLDMTRWWVDGSKTRAELRGPDGALHEVEVGDRVGPDGGKVVRIAPTEVVVGEIGFSLSGDPDILVRVIKLDRR